jgi:D-arabinose 1-dehydrogenase-like Zn-dependent alcohol dehydrogenase
VGEQGVVILAAANLADTIRAGGRVLAGSATERAEDIAHLLQLLGERKLDPVTEVLGGLDAIVEAYRRVDSGRKVGNLVVQPWA